MSSQLGTLLEGAVLKGGEELAVVYVQTGQADIFVSREECRHNIWQVAATLQALNIQAGDLVVIAHTQSLESIYAFWGALVIGAIPSMFPTLTEKLDPVIYQQSIAKLVQLSAVKAVLTTDEFAPVLAQTVSCTVYGSVKKDEAKATRAPFTPFAPSADAIAFLQHSSGTTGLQKGVALSHRAVLNQLESYGAAIGLQKEDVVVSWLPLYHDMGLIAGFLLPLVMGVPLVLISPFDWVAHPAMLFRAIAKHGGSLCWLPNFAYNHCARRVRERDLSELHLERMRLFVNCSEPVRADSHRLFLERFAPLGVRTEMLGVCYAMAENSFAVTQTVPGVPALSDTISRHDLEQYQIARPVAENDPDAVVKISCGKTIGGTAVQILDGQNQPLPDRHLGQIAIQSNCLLTEYYRRPDLQPFWQGWYLTGDIGYTVAGELFVVGRKKEMIINAGKNIYPQDLEAILNTIPGVHPGRVVVFGVADEQEGTERIIVVAETDNLPTQQQAQLTKTIRQEIARQSMVTVSQVKLVDSQWLIKTSSGKIARHANRQKWTEEAGLESAGL